MISVWGVAPLPRSQFHDFYAILRNFYAILRKKRRRKVASKALKHALSINNRVAGVREGVKTRLAFQ